MVAAFDETGQPVTTLVFGYTWLMGTEWMTTEYRTMVSSGGDILAGKRSEDGKTLYFYATKGAGYQLNADGTQYRIVAVG